LHDTDARPIQKSTSAKKLQFGYTGQIFDNTDGLILDYDLAIHYPPDGPRLLPGLARIKNLFGRLPDNLTADRGYGDKATVEAVANLDISCVAILQKGKPGAERTAFEKSDPVQTLVKWRSGSEGRVSTMKRRWGWARTRLANLHGASTWCGWGVFAHNTHKIGLLLANINT
jgi:transposase, IS5 family